MKNLEDLDLPKTVVEWKKLAVELCRLLEKAYRRGFQQGHGVGVVGGATEQEVALWRFAKGGRYSDAVCPPGTRLAGEEIVSLYERVLAEASGFPVAERFLSTFIDPDPTQTVYFALARQTGQVKIGHTKGDPASRLSTLQTGSPHELILLHSIDGERSKEGEFHAQFGGQRTRGEWFKLDGELLAYLCKSMTFEELTRLDPRLKLLEKRIIAFSDHEAKKAVRCANDSWFGYTTPSSAWDPHLQSLVGWHRTVLHTDQAVDPILRSSGVYDTVFDHLYSLLPDCRGCGCMGIRDARRL